MTGTVLDFAGSTAPSGWALCYGQAVSRTTFANLFAKIGTTYGAGDGSTTFNLPDCRGRAVAGKDDMGGTASGRLNVNTTGTTTAGSAVVTGIPSTAGLAKGMSAIGSTLPAGVTILSIDSATQVTLSTGTGVTAGTSQAIRFGVVDGATLGSAGGSHIHTLETPQLPSHSHTIPYSGNTNRSTGAGSETVVESLGPTTASSSVGGGQAHPNIQPTLVLNKIIKT